MSRKNKKSGSKKLSTTDKALLVTAIIKLMSVTIELIKDLIE